MNVGNCKNCNKVIQYTRLPICKDCEEMFLKKVKEYIRENGTKTVEEIKNATQVPIKVIEYFVEIGALYETEMPLPDSKEELKKYKNILLMNELKKSMQASAQSNLKSDKKDNKNSFHYINTDKKR